MGKLEGKIALVTGANSGIGLAIAKRFISEGASVIITARRKPQLDEAVSALGPKATGIPTDISKLSDLDSLFSAIKTKFGHLDIVVANAGVGDLQPLGEITEDSYDRTFNTNVKGTLFTVQKALPLLRPTSSVIITGSSASVMGTAAFSVYSATKAAIRNLVRSWILDLRGKGIRINVLSPGPVKTPGLSGIVPAEHEQALLDTLRAQVPLDRIADPDEIGKVAVFLASDDSSYVNGAELFADGGAAQV